MKKGLSAAVAASALFLSASAVANPAQSSFYGGISYSKVDVSDGDVSLDLPVLSGRLGGFINENISLEARFGVGAGDDSFYVGPPLDGDVTVEVSRMLGFYARIGGYIDRNIYPYFIIGHTSVDYDFKFAGMTDSEDDSDTSFGLGVDLMTGQQLIINAEYLQLLDADGVEADGLSIGATFRF